MNGCNSADFWKRVKSLCKNAKVTQEKLCTDLDFNLGSYKNRIVRSIAPDVFDAQKIAFYLGVSVEYLVTGKNLQTLIKERSALAEKTENSYEQKYANLKKAMLKTLENN